MDAKVTRNIPNYTNTHTVEFTDDNGVGLSFHEYSSGGIGVRVEGPRSSFTLETIHEVKKVIAYLQHYVDIGKLPAEEIVTPKVVVTE